MKKWKRALALISAVALILLYVSTLVFALMDSPFANEMLMASIAATIIVPVLLYALRLFANLHNNDDESNERR